MPKSNIDSFLDRTSTFHYSLNNPFLTSVKHYLLRKILRWGGEIVIVTNTKSFCREKGTINWTLTSSLMCQIFLDGSHKHTQCLLRTAGKHWNIWKNTFCLLLYYNYCATRLQLSPTLSCHPALMLPPLPALAFLASPYNTTNYLLFLEEGKRCHSHGMSRESGFPKVSVLVLDAVWTMSRMALICTSFLDQSLFVYPSITHVYARRALPLPS